MSDIPHILIADDHPLVLGALRQAVSELPERCREVFELSRVQGLKYAEIALVLDISIKSVETHIGRALRALRKRLAKWLPETDQL